MDEGPSAGRNGQYVRSAPEHDKPLWPPTAEQGEDGTWLGPAHSSPGVSVRCCALGCPRLPQCLLSSKQGSMQRYHKQCISGCPGHPTQRCPPFLSPPCELFLEDVNTQQVQSTPERPLTSNVTLGFQFSFCLALVESPCRKSCGKEERGTARTVTFSILIASPLLLLPGVS